MAEVRIFYQEGERFRISKSMQTLKEVPTSDLLWIDLIDVAVEVESELEQFLKIYIQEDEEMEEIEISSRYMETEDGIVANSSFLLDDFDAETISFIVKRNILVTVRDRELRSFNETVKKLFATPRNYPSGYFILIALLETRVDYDADMIEDMTRAVTLLSGRLKTEDDVDDEVFLEITELQEKTMKIRENIVDKQRVCSNMLKSDQFPNNSKQKISIIIKDINSLFEHTRFSFDRLEYLQDTFIGLVNIQQNKIMKMFTIVNLIFLPPTLIAGLYGMNFKFMPELNWEYGYPFAILLMLIFVGGFLLFFKNKKWL